ncbi:S-adenosyl-L-methionine-dependent methyltransferase [Microstroma glucosiphilum]|uniref:Leucine carboxyl methyltransferase 1 n=1 Tax=Pseudomicrostroma glucosiphilum TaxID=1684307 RepID=A0A316UG96_9BASI|nr:S-adenosyl-L-methionine-dependent methyltransferase [Pseudomicrostroma glucosiphilum]PWN22175.1 S-adenosyl-L-methionine-dependent methyltransferase [Pseudomicrostroma glucosiphilum]
MSAPLRDPYAEPSSSSSSSRPGPSLSLGLPRSKGGRPTLLNKTSSSNGKSSRGEGADGEEAQPALSGAELRRKYEDDSIRGTDGDALGSRLSALQAGYFASATSQQDNGIAGGSSAGARRAGQDRETDIWSALFSGGGGAAPMPPPSHTNGPASASGSSSHAGPGGSTLSSLPRHLGPPPVTRRPPIINIGTYLRCEMIDRLVEDFLLADAEGARDGTSARKGKGRQIISVGAGSDARYWRIMSNSRLAPHLSHYLELDFPQIVTKKLASIQRFPRLQEHLHPASPLDPQAQAESSSGNSEGPALHTQKYTLQSCDLRALSGSSPGAQAESLLASLDPDTPTLILAECVLAYMPPEASVQLLKRIASKIEYGSEVRGICYEMCVAGDDGGEGGDVLGEGSVQQQTREKQQQKQMQSEGSGDVSKFGKVMLANLETRGLSLQGARAFPTPLSHANRFRAAFTPSHRIHASSAGVGSTSGTVTGLSGTVIAGASSLRQIWRSLPPQERERLSRVEGLDEVEELELLLSCYSLSWATRKV